MSYSYLSILHWHQPVFLHSCLTGKWAYYKLALAYKVVTLANHDNREYIPTTRCGFISVVSGFYICGVDVYSNVVARFIILNVISNDRGKIASQDACFPRKRGDVA